MAVILFCSGPGSPGVTLTSLALALSWPQPVLLVDCNREPAQPVLAGYLRGLNSANTGIPALIELHRRGHSLNKQVWLLTLPLTQDEQITRRFLPGFPHPGAVQLFDGIWPAFATALAGLREGGIDVLVDVGHIGLTGLPEALLRYADAVVVVARSDLRCLAALRLHLPTLSAQLSHQPTPVALGLSISGPNRPYGNQEIAKQLGTEVWLDLPHDPKSAHILLDGEPEPRRFGSGALLSRARSGAQQLRQRITRSRAGQEVLSGEK